MTAEEGCGGSEDQGESSVNRPVILRIKMVLSSASLITVSEDKIGTLRAGRV